LVVLLSLESMIFDYGDNSRKRVLCAAETEEATDLSANKLRLASEADLNFLELRER